MVFYKKITHRNIGLSRGNEIQEKHIFFRIAPYVYFE